jgi:hypothetical protein
MSASASSPPSPSLENVFSYGQCGKLWDTFKYYWMDDETQFCIYTLISLSRGDIDELVVLETRGKPSPITSAYKWNIYIFQAWYRELLLKDEWDDDMKIFDLDLSQYDHFCHECQKDKVSTMPAPAVPIGYKQAISLHSSKEMKQWDKWNSFGWQQPQHN